MSTDTGSSKSLKNLKKSTNKKKFKTDSTILVSSSGGQVSTGTTTATSTSKKRSPKSLIQKLNIGKVYKSHKKKLQREFIEETQEVINKKELTSEIDMTSSQETLCPMDDEQSSPEKQKQQEIELKKQENVPQQEKQANEQISSPGSSSVAGKNDTKSPLNSETALSVDEDSTNTLVPEEKASSEQSLEKDFGPFSEQLGQPSSNDDNEATENLKKECLYKILVIGELGTGKTSIIKRYVHQFFSQHYRATIGVDFALKVLNWDPNTIIRLQLWDIAGQERFGNMTRVYYKEAVGAFIVFDVTRAATFDAVIKWKQDLDAKVQLPDGSPIPCVLLANKCDQQKEGIVNNPGKMNEYCDEHKFTAWFETSAKENINIEEAAKTLVKEILNNDITNDNGRNGAKDSSKFPLDGHIENTGEKKGCSC